ncbi:MAG: CDP-diacylglycerol--serine O-phosphatidyltransferase [Rhodospirillales bacterium]|jgi:CDP-diacylglycerol--serine O-phosphatidyltransferase|nr:CDP-diacylglycerol--serine O-phosphatidyltransferase [Rhodospirillales bacterium]
MARIRRRRRLKGLPFNRMIPNILTMLALSAGMTAVRFGLQDQWKPAVVAITAAAILDALDGRIARMLKGTSKFGAELDSLSDFICFGVAPSVMLYLWSMKDAGNFGWVLVLLFSVCCALRLARFNTALEEPDRPSWAHNYFSGVPAPAGAGLVLLPMILSFQAGDAFFREPAVVGAFLIVVSGLLVSRIPTYAFKSFRVPHQWVLPTMLFVGLLVASIVGAPWATLTAVIFVYIIGIPFAVRSYRGLQTKAEALLDRDDGEKDDDGEAAGG